MSKSNFDTFLKQARNQVGWVLVVLSAMNFASFLIRIV